MEYPDDALPGPQTRFVPAILRGFPFGALSCVVFLLHVSEFVSAGLTAGLLVLAAAPASAQEAGVFLEEITVTAQRREERIEDVPISVSATTGEDLAEILSGGEDIRALAGRIPSVNAESSNGRAAPRFYIRGLGNTDFDLAASQPVLIVVDEVVKENVVLKSFPLFDIRAGGGPARSAGHALRPQHAGRHHQVRHQEAVD